MTLHETVENMKKGGLVAGAGIAGIIVLVVLFRIGVFLKNIVFPPQIAPPSYAYGKLPAMSFPANSQASNFSYTLDTDTGQLPDFPVDRLAVFKIIPAKPSLLSVQGQLTQMVSNIGFVSLDGNPLPGNQLANGDYQWVQPTGINKTITFNSITFDFNMTSSYLVSNTVLTAQGLGDQTSAIQQAQKFLNDMTLFPTDVDITKTQTPPPDQHFVTAPQLYNIKNHALVPITSLADAKIIRVDFYQKDIQYDLNTGRVGEGDNSPLITKSMTVPVVYPNPPFSTMNFLIAASPDQIPEVVQADFTHQVIDLSNKDATYPIKTVNQAFEDLKAGKAYIASFAGNGNNISIKNAYLAYYIGKTAQQYLMPVAVFEGKNNFFAYVPLVTDEGMQ